jgi:hypothetical protein
MSFIFIFENVKVYYAFFDHAAYIVSHDNISFSDKLL